MACPLARFFGFAERRTDLATELRAGVTTFMVMAYIIFVNPIVLGYVGVQGLEAKGLPFAATLTATCLTAGGRPLVMGPPGNHPPPPAPRPGPHAAGPCPLGGGGGGRRRAQAEGDASVAGG